MALTLLIIAGIYLVVAAVFARFGNLENPLYGLAWPYLIYFYFTNR